MKRQAAFENTGNKMLKGALHCHTTRSDGRGTPEEVIAKHADHGYDFMALTDHRIYNKKNFGDRPMTILPGVELDERSPRDAYPEGRALPSHRLRRAAAAEGDGLCAGVSGFRRPRISSGSRILRPHARRRACRGRGGVDHLLPPPMAAVAPASQFRTRPRQFCHGDLEQRARAIENELRRQRRLLGRSSVRGTANLGRGHRRRPSHGASLPRLGARQQRKQRLRRHSRGAEERRVLLLLRPGNRGFLRGERRGACALLGCGRDHDASAVCALRRGLCRGGQAAARSLLQDSPRRRNDVCARGGEGCAGTARVEQSHFP